MIGNNKGAMALAIAGVLGLSIGTAEAGWRDTARKHGAGYYIDTYVDKHVTQDNKYKGNKHDTYSGEYYNTKTGKWTGKKSYDGEYASTSSGTGTKKVAKKSTSVQTASSKQRAIGGSTATAAKTIAKKPDADVPSYSAAGTNSAEVYGPPMPENSATVAELE